jgi:hypothetical protein
VTGSIRELQQLVSKPTGGAPYLGDVFLMRLSSAIDGLLTGTSAGEDVAALLRQGMLRCWDRDGVSPEFRVPRGLNWPDRNTWDAFSCDAHVAGPDHYLVRPRLWTPDWLDQDSIEALGLVFAEQNRRVPLPVPSDPLVAHFAGFDSYASRGQRAAVQAAFLIPPGSTAIIALPTGGGKTLAFQLPALAYAAEGGVAVVVVPTVALARDQEVRFRNLIAEQPGVQLSDDVPLAYHSGLGDEQRNALRRAVRDGGVPVVFASPEAVMGTLRGPLFDAAQQGRLRLFAIDEAHVVAQWGQQFRPEFQTLAGLRDALLDVCPQEGRFRTLLLTATLTQECFDSLRALFGRGGCQLVSEVALRPEPSFLISSANQEPARLARVLEAARFLPRPLILYSTLREHASAYFDALRGLGFRRVRLARGGDLTGADGEDILRDWRARAVDIIVATSAFGLGMDQDDVRSVMHACLPETIDRYYQEVGRGGRDGKASAALLVTTPSDVITAEHLSIERLISIDRAFERWEAMWSRRRTGIADAHTVSLNDRPADIADPGDRNASWNLRTLVLMARAGLVSFAPHRPPDIERRLNEADADFDRRRQQEFERFSQEVALRIEDARHSDKRHWNDAVHAVRASLRAADIGSVALVRELRNLQRPLNQIFREIYSLSDPPVRAPNISGNCPVTRQNHVSDFRGEPPELTDIAHTCASLSAVFERALAQARDDSGRVWIAYDAVVGDNRELRRWRERFTSFLRYAVSGGVAELSLPSDLVSDTDWARLTAHSPYRFLIRTPDRRIAEEQDVTVMPRLTLIEPQDDANGRLISTMSLSRPVHLIVLPRAMPDPTHSHRRLLDVRRHVSLEDLLARLAA